MLLNQTFKAFTIHGKIWKSHTKDESKISVPTWKEKFQLPDSSYTASDIEDCFEYILKSTWGKDW